MGNKLLHHYDNQIKLVVTFTDDQHRLQFAAEYSNDVKRLEKFLTSKMRSYCDYVDE